MLGCVSRRFRSDHITNSSRWRQPLLKVLQILSTKAGATLSAIRVLRCAARGAMQRLRVLAGHFAAEGGDEAVCRQPASSSEPAGPASSLPVRYKSRTGIDDQRAYEAMYRKSINDPAAFWGGLANEFTWKRKWQRDHTSSNIDTNHGRIFTEWFKGAQTNLAYNCLDRHIQAGHGDRPCFLFEGNDPGQERVLTYAQTLQEVCRLANWLREQRVKKGDAVAIYMPMICELPIAMLACARIGAVHTVVFGGFSADALSARVIECKARVIITASASVRGKKSTPLKKIVDQGCRLADKGGFQVERVLVCEHPASPARSTSWVKGRDVWWHDSVPHQRPECEVEWVDAEAPSFLLFTSGSTGKPKGVQHSTGGYMVGAAVTAKYAFDLQPGDVFWCTADCGWITGHTYLTYGPLLNGATCVVYEGVPAHPDAGRMWATVAKYKVRQLYTSPTLIRALEAQDDSWVMRHDLSSLRVLGTVGEPINPRAWQWFFEVVGQKRCPIVDTWWQTETGMIMLTPLPGAWPLKPGCATLPFFGVEPVLLDDKGKELKGPAEGLLALRHAWPAMMRTLLGDQQRFEDTYFGPMKGFYFTGDGARRDEEGYLWITGRVDDVINVSGHRVGTAEVESALTSHPACTEAAVVGVDHDLKGQGIYAYVILHEGQKFSDELKKALSQSVREQIGAFAVPETLHLAPGLPKTRSGKIMRRVLRKIAEKKDKELGDLSSLADPNIVEQLLQMRGK